MRVAHRSLGTGPPLVLLHGAVCDSRVWRVELQTFADQFRVVAWDAPGCGASDDPPTTWRMDDFVTSLTGLLEVLDIGPAHVLGHSWGSTLALSLARRRPELVRSLVLVGGYAGWAGSLPPEEVQRRLEFALDVADRGTGGFQPHAMPGLFSAVMPPDRAAELAAIMGEVRPAGTRAMALALAEADLSGWLGDIRAPTLLVAGEDDERSPVPVAEALHRGLPDSELVVLPGLGHECYLESPSAFDAVVRPFLLRH
jgi:pimeloyl-ACP methyl ester carboxylesterase